MVPKYARMEYERRFLVGGEERAGERAGGWRERAEAYRKEIADRYLACGRLRLREIRDSDSGRRVLKLTKKYAPESTTAGAIVTAWLDEGEYEALRKLDGFDLVKTRHYVAHAGATFSVDVFAGALAGLELCSVEVEDPGELARIEPPPFALDEVTDDVFFTGGHLCRVSADELRRALASRQRRDGARAG